MHSINSVTYFSLYIYGCIWSPGYKSSLEFKFNLSILYEHSNRVTVQTKMFCNMYVQFLMKDYNEEIIFCNESNTIGALLIVIFKSTKRHYSNITDARLIINYHAWTFTNGNWTNTIFHCTDSHNQKLWAQTPEWRCSRPQQPCILLWQ